MIISTRRFIVAGSAFISIYDLPEDFDFCDEASEPVTIVVSPVWIWRQENSNPGEVFSVASPLFYDFGRGIHKPMVRIFQNSWVHTLWLSDHGPPVETRYMSPLTHNGTLSVGVERALWMSSTSGVITIYLLNLPKSDSEHRPTGSYQLPPVNGSTGLAAPIGFDEISGRAILVLSGNSGQEVYVADVL